MQAGKLSNTITLERLTETVAPSGAVGSSWTPLATVRAQVTTLEAEDAQAAPGGPQRARVTVLIRHREDLELGDRFTHQGRAFTIISVSEIGRRKGLELKAIAA